MHLLVTAHDLYPDPGSGGTGRYVYETARRLVDRGHRVSVITRRRGDVPRRERIDGLDVYRYDVDVAGENGLTVARQLPSAAATVAEFVAEADDGPRRPPDESAIDAVSFQGPLTSLLAHQFVPDSVPRTAVFHSPWPTEYRIRADHENRLGALRRRANAELRHALEARVLDACSDVVALSEFMADRLRERYSLGVDPAVVPGGVDVERYSPDAGPSDLLTDGGGATFLTVRRLSPRMGHDLLLEAFAGVVERHPDAELYVAGDGPLREDLEALAADLGLDANVTFLGYVPGETLPALYAGADVFVLPTRQLEGFGLATLEALASGTPVVGTAVGGTVEVLSDYSEAVSPPAPLLVPEPAAGALERRLAEWAALSPDERARVGEACRRHTERRFAWERTVDALEGRLGRLAARERPHRHTQVER